jgi:hypothetical protein
MGIWKRHRELDELAAEGLGRRELLRQGLIWSGTATAAALGSTAVLGSPAGAGTELAYDVACLGDTLRIIFAPGANPSDMRGSTFSVEGVIYPAGTVPATGFDPRGLDGVGRWICRGWFLIAPGRPEPHVITTQEYLFGDISAARLYPRDQLVSSGMEGSKDESQPAVRSVTGGTGRYAGARGVVFQHGNGTNTTALGPGGALGPAPNFRFEFRLD